MPELQVWVVDPLVKVFPETRVSKGSPKAIVLDAARNEAESGQLAIHAKTAVTVRVQASPLVHSDGDVRIDDVAVSAVGYVYLERQTPDIPKAQLVHKAPALFPDVLTGEIEVRVEPGQTQAMWLTVRVPADARPGTYRGQMTLNTPRDLMAVPVELTVYAATVPEARSLNCAPWFYTDTVLTRHIPSAVYPRDGYWRVLRAIARNMRAHRQNVLRLPFGPSVNGPIATLATGIDGLAFDFAGFDRVVELFIEEGAADLIAGRHIGGRPGSVWTAPSFVVYGLLNAGGVIASADLKADSPECLHFLRCYFTALHRHLQAKGWLGKFVQHICDEPTDDNAASYIRLAKTVRDFMPGVRIIDAVHTTKLDDLVDVWVPQLDHYLDNQRFYRTRQKNGDQAWFYTCCNPKGGYPNRFLDRSLLDVRLIHWMNFAFGATGYLHWGYNYWNVDDPRRQAHVRDLPGGDSWIVYPTAEGVLDSIRHEAMRDGIEDYELLRLLERGHPRQVQTLVRTVVKSGTFYTKSLATFRKARRRLLELVSD